MLYSHINATLILTYFYFLSLEKVNFGYMCVCFLLGHYVYFIKVYYKIGKL